MSGKAILFSNIYELMTLQQALVKKARGPFEEEDLSIYKNQCMVVQSGKLVWHGTKKQIPKIFFSADEKKINGNVFPAFIDCHTHSVFLGDRKNEFELRNTGVSYQDISRQGGGITKTVKATGSGTVKELSLQLKLHLDAFLKQGVTTVEVKTGYGKSGIEELKILEAIKRTKTDVQIVPTFLGAHTVPAGSTAQQYLKELKKTLSVVAQKKFAKRVDIFIEQGYYSIEQAEEYLSYAQSLGFDICLHADQLSRTGAALLAKKLNAKSTDHNVCVNEQDIKKLADSDVTCVLLPNADFYIHCPYPPARKMMDKGVRVALSTDFNPGTSPSQSVQLVGLLARLKMNMSLAEVFVAWTLGAAYALGVEKTNGALVSGMEANFFVCEEDWQDFFYDLLRPQISSVWIKGVQKV